MVVWQVPPSGKRVDLLLVVLKTFSKCSGYAEVQTESRLTLDVTTAKARYSSGVFMAHVLAMASSGFEQPYPWGQERSTAAFPFIQACRPPAAAAVMQHPLQNLIYTYRYWDIWIPVYKMDFCSNWLKTRKKRFRRQGQLRFRSVSFCTTRVELEGLPKLA